MVGRTGRGPVAELVEEYAGRIGRITQWNEQVVPEWNGPPVEQPRREGDRILAAIKAGEKVVALDERGREHSSVGLATVLSTWQDQGVRDVVFVVGGAYGLDDRVRQRADLVLSLSQLTFPHQLVRVVLVEQLYRALTIIKGLPYHH